MAWGSSGLKSCDALLQRIENNDPTLQSVVILPIKTFGTEQVERLANILSKGNNTYLTSISASGHGIPPLALQILGKSLASNNSNIQYLSIGDENMGDEGIEALCLPSLAEVQGGSLQHVDFGFKNISSVGASILGHVFGSSHNLQKLELYRNPNLGNEGIVTLTESAKKTSSSANGDGPFPMLHMLDISECNVGATGIEALVNCLVLVERKRITPMDINVSRNPLTTIKSSLALGRLISSNTVCRLSLRNCSLGDDGIVSFLQVFQEEPYQLSFLDLSKNDISEKGAKGIAFMLELQKQHNSFITEINLSGNEKIGCNGIVALASSITRSGTIQSLDIGSTNCGMDGAIAILKCTSIRSLRLFDNHLGSEGLKALAPILKGGHSTLNHLDLGGNRASQSAVVEILRAIMIQNEPEDDSVLETLELGGNQGGDEVERILEQLQSIRPKLDVVRDKPSKRQQDNGFSNMPNSWMQN